MSLSTRRLSARTVREAGGAETLRELAALIDAAAGSCVVSPLTDQRAAAILARFAITTPWSCPPVRYDQGYARRPGREWCRWLNPEFH